MGPMVVYEETLCEDVAAIMTTLHYDQLPVVNTSDKSLIGVVTMNDLAIKLAAKNTTNLWTISKMFESAKFIIVTGNDTEYNVMKSEDVVTYAKKNTGDGSLCGIISSSDFYNFLAKQ